MKTILLAFAALMLFTPADAANKKSPRKKQVTKHKPTYYYNSDGTLSSTPGGNADAKRPSSYKGDNVPENDGQKKNEQRNMNYNSGQALPASNGK